MPSKRISFSNFNRKLVVAGGREQGGPMAVRRASGVAPESTNSVFSRWGSTLLYSGIAAIQLYWWNGDRYQYDGSKLYKNGSSIMTGFNGGRLTFNSMPPQIGLADYLFVLGGGVTPFKIDPSGNITKWGMVAPPNQAQAINLANDQIVLDSFDGSSANYANTNCTLTDESTIVAIGAGSMKINPGSGAAWNAEQTYSSAKNWAYYTNNDFSLQTDIFQIWVYLDAFPTAQPGTWLEIDIDVNDGTFKKDWFSFAIGLLNSSSANPHVNHNVNYDVTFQVGQWQQITWAKSQFVRHGTEMQLDWSMVQAIRLKGGNLASGNLYVDNFTLSGGSAMGAGPAAGNGGSEYDYFVTYLNLTTGSESNPNDDPIRVFDVSVNKTELFSIPVSSDPQVGARNLYRTTALIIPGGGDEFYLDTIYDNTTATYIDRTADVSYRLVTTPWTKSIAVPPATPPTNPSTFHYFIDPGNGYYFKLTTNGFTGANPPTWVIPTTSWSQNQAFVLNETVAPLKAGGQFWEVTAITGSGLSGVVEPNWAAFGTPGDTIQDNEVTWTNKGTKTTADNTAVWTFQGINSTPVLGNNQLLLDNAPPKITYGDAVGPFQGSMLWCRDSATGAAGYVYASPPGRPESVGQIYQIGSTNDPTEKLVIWDGALFLLTQAQAFQVVGEYPEIAPSTINGAAGTLTPYTVVSLQEIGIVYWAPDGIRVLTWAGSRLIGFAELAPVFRGQNEENIAAWSANNGPVFASLARDEIVFSDGAALSLALAYDGLPQGGLAWRQPGPIFTAMYYEPQTGQIAASFGGKVYLFENPGQLTDGGNAIPFQFQSAGDMPDVGAEFTTQRIYLTINPNTSSVPQVLTPVLIIDGIETSLPAITGNKRITFELSPKLPGRFFDGVRLDGNLTGRVEIYRVEADVWLGEQQPPPSQ